jgi:von Willebrand factor type A domain/Aerotolerance regulator N-terminal
MSWGILNAAVLVGLLGTALPLVIHLLNRRRGEVIDWGAMQFLEPGRRARRRIRLAEILLMAARMGLLALVVLALARPFWAMKASAQAGAGVRSEPGGPPRDIVLILDVSESMERKIGDGSALDRARAWASRFALRCRPGDSIALLLAGDGVERLIDPPTFDMGKVDALIDQINSPRGASDLPAALAEALRILERTGNPSRDVIVLTDGQRFPWRPGETSRWSLLRALRQRQAVPPRIWSIAFEPDPSSGGPNASVGPLSVSRSLVTPGLPLEVTTDVSNAGPGPFSGAAELLVDEQPSGAAPQAVGPIPAGGRTPLHFRTSLALPGSHVLAVRLPGGDTKAADHAGALPVQVVPALPVLLVNGEPGVEPFSGETDFLRAALAPSDDETPQFRIRVIGGGAFNGQALVGMKVVVLANVDRISLEQSAALGDFVEAGGGILVAPGDRTEASTFNDAGWMPVKLGAWKGSASEGKVIAHPSPRTVSGPLMTAFGRGEAPALADADFFAFDSLEPAAGSAVLARLDLGEPWLVERSAGRGRVLVVATSIDAEGGTLPVNPDFVPLAHEWIFHLAGGGDSLLVRAGEPLVFPLEASPPEDVKVLAVETPSGRKRQAEVVRHRGLARARFDDTSESGIYRLSLLPDPPGGVMYGAVARDERESDMTPLDPSEAAKLAEGWPFEYVSGAKEWELGLFAAERGSRQEVWRMLILAALAGLCLEIYLTRRLVRVQAAGDGSR